MADIVQDPSPPRILLFALQTSHTGSCRLPKLLKDAGFVVGVAALPNGLLYASRHSDRKFAILARRFEPLIRIGLERAFRGFSPDIIVPCDERAIALVSHWLTAEGGNKLSAALAAKLAASLGDVETLTLRLSKTRTLALARSIGISCPTDIKVSDLADCEAAAARLGYPVMLKLSHGAGGKGVRVCRTVEELRQAYGAYRMRHAPLTRLWRLLFGGGWFAAGHDIFVQEMVRGRPAMSCATALDGRALSIVSAVVSQTVDDTGPASVVTLGHHPGVVDATARMTEAMGVSGFVSFDFIADDDGRAWLLECNPRPTQMVHLGPLVGVDPARALAAALRQEAASGFEKPVEEVPVAFFPQEWRRDPESASLREMYHDVPWDDPNLLAAMLRKKSTPARRRLAP